MKINFEQYTIHIPLNFKNERVKGIIQPIMIEKIELK